VVAGQPENQREDRSEIKPFVEAKRDLRGQEDYIINSKSVT
jgi:hypothetical protein